MCKALRNLVTLTQHHLVAGQAMRPEIIAMVGRNEPVRITTAAGSVKRPRYACVGIVDGEQALAAAPREKIDQLAVNVR